jgi:hypothetical protein
MGDRLFGAPGTPFDQKAGGALGNAERRSRHGIGADSLDAMLCRAPRNAFDKPGTGRTFGECLGIGLRNRIEVDQPLFRAEWLFAGKMQADEVVLGAGRGV